MIKMNQVESWDSIDPKWWKPFTRANHEVLCGCGEPLWRHGQPLKELCPTMLQDCDGNWWKS